MKEINCLAAMGLVLAVSTTAVAQATEDQPGDIDEIVVYGFITETEGAFAIDKAEIDRSVATTIDEVFRNIAGVEALQGPGRQFFDFNLRGTEGAGNVVVTIDGAEKNLVTTKHGTTFNPVFAIPEFLKTVSLIRGPVSNTFGTGSIGGRIQFQTIDPFDYVGAGDAYGGLLSWGAETNGNGYYGTGAAAASLTDDIAVLGGVSYRSYGSYDDGGGEEVLNSGNETFGLLGKLQWTPTSDIDVEAAFQRAEFNYIGSNIFGQSNNRQDADFENDIVDTSISLSLDYNPSGLDGLTFHIDGFFTDTSHDETLLESRRGATGDPGDADMRDIQSFGGKAYVGYRFSTGFLEHDVYAGASGVTDDLEFIGDSDDVSGTRSSYGFFLQDSIQIGNHFTLIPGVRYELFDLERDNGPGTDGDFFLPKVTGAFHPLGRDNGLQIFASYSEGLRAPRLNNLTVDATSSRTRRGSTTTTIIIASDNLQAELSENIEAGLRYRGSLFGDDALRFSFTAFRNDSTDRIEDVILSRVTMGNTTTITRQLQNVGEARVQGIEADIRYDAGFIFAGGQFSTTDGERRDTGDPLNSVRPTQGSAFVGVRFLDEKLEIGGEVESFDGKIEIGENDNVVGDSTEGATIFNLFGVYRFTPGVQATARINNVGDRLYRLFDQIDNSIGLNGKIALTVTF